MIVSNYKRFPKYCITVLKETKRYILVIMLLMIVVNGQTISSGSQGSKVEARRIWELAIKAKGGREKLHAVRNIVITSGAKGIRNLIFRKGRGVKKSKKYRPVLQSFIVFPNRIWKWGDLRPSKLGLRMSMENFVSRKKYIVDYGGVPEDWSVEPIELNKTNSTFEDMVTLLLETKWTQPMIMGFYRSKVGRKRVNVVQTSIPNYRIDFMFDLKTNMLRRVVGNTDKKISWSVKYADYCWVSGIKMPTKVTFESEFGNMTWYKTYQINVEYNEGIFEKPPLPVEDGFDSWKKNNRVKRN